MSSSSSSCLNWVSCSCYSTDVSLTKSCSLILWTFIHQALKANSDLIINSITLHQAPQMGGGLLYKEKRNKETLPFSRAESSKHTLKYHSSHADFTGLEVAPLNKPEQLFSALSEQTISYTSSYGAVEFLPYSISKLVSRHLVLKHSYPYCFSLSHTHLAIGTSQWCL